MPSKILCAVLVLTAACASGGTSSSTSAADAASAERRDRSLITSAELADPTLHSLSAYDAIRSLRPNFLSNRGMQTIPYEGSGGTVDSEAGKVHASIDGHGIVPVDELKRLPANGIIEIRLLSPAAAMQKFGATAKQGPVILVTTM
ncbi:MAG: hypothetical protein ACYC0B_03875 [Gemmatimonadaceae bacterium]